MRHISSPLHIATFALACAAFVGLTGPATFATGQIVAFGAQAPAIDEAVVSETAPGPAPQVSTAELKSLLASGTAILIDARPPAEFGMSHIPAA